VDRKGSTAEQTKKVAIRKAKFDSFRDFLKKIIWITAAIKSPNETRTVV
jgi:hypothetical protein